MIGISEQTQTHRVVDEGKRHDPLFMTREEMVAHIEAAHPVTETMDPEWRVNPWLAHAATHNMGSDHDHEPKAATLYTDETVCDVSDSDGTRQSDQINALETQIGERGSLSTLVWNIRNRYLAHPGITFTAAEVRTLVEAFLAEVEAVRAG